MSPSAASPPAPPAPAPPRRLARSGFVWAALPFVAFLTSLVALGSSSRLGAAQDPRLRGVRVAPGVVVRRILRENATVRVIEVDLAAPGVRVGIAAEDIARRVGRVTGRARTLPSWLEATGAVAGVNGGFFGVGVDQTHIEVVGLLKREGRVRSAAPVHQARGSSRTYVRSAFGITGEGTPRIAWVSSRPGDPQALRSHASPEATAQSRPWSVREAVACGPRLIHDGKVAVAARGERLASPGALPRTFLGYAGPAGRPRYLLLCAADVMEFGDCAAFLMEYCRRYHQIPCSEAMALDGGGSTQLGWREGGHTVADPDAGREVPTAVLVYSSRQQTGTMKGR